jgi:hypothetical protein
VIEAQEHFYQDDPLQGHPDVRTRLKDVSYFFLGNGLIQAAVQWAPSGEGSPVGLLVMDPEVLGKKRESLTMDQESGLEKTMARILVDGAILGPEPGSVQVRWLAGAMVPTVEIAWDKTPWRVEERLSCPSLSRPALIRDITIENSSRTRMTAVFQTGVRDRLLCREIDLGPRGREKLAVEYRLDSLAREVDLGFIDGIEPEPDAAGRWERLASISFGSDSLDHFFTAAKCQLSAVVSRSGRVDGSLWQYNREWVRDQAMLAAALCILGEFETARLMLDRLLIEFVTQEGDTVDSSRLRDPDEVELDQNGFLLTALEDYVRWTGDRDLVKKHWSKVIALAEFPLKGAFRHAASGLLANGREFWERHRVHGIAWGMEMAHQMYASLGLTAAAALAGLIGRDEKSASWKVEAARLKIGMLQNEKYGLVDKGRLIKRRGIDGSVQETIEALPEALLPPTVPLTAKGNHYLNPDTSVALPIALGFVAGDSPLAARTMGSLEPLWNQAWTGGGYGRYHVSSEPDSPGAWPFASLFVARACVEAGDVVRAARILRWLGTLPGAAAGSWFEFYGERLAPPFPQVGLTPWTWAEMTFLLVHHILGLRPGHDHIRVRPRFLPDMGPVQASFPFRRGRLSLEVTRDRKAKTIRVESDAKILTQGKDDVILACPETGNLNVHIALP